MTAAGLTVAAQLDTEAAQATHGIVDDDDDLGHVHEQPTATSGIDTAARRAQTAPKPLDGLGAGVHRRT